MEDDGSEYDFHVFTSLKSGMVRIPPLKSKLFLGIKSATPTGTGVVWSKSWQEHMHI
jgi:hypothetical protein